MIARVSPIESEYSTCRSRGATIVFQKSKEVSYWKLGERNCCRHVPKSLCLHRLHRVGRGRGSHARAAELAMPTAATLHERPRGIGGRRGGDGRGPPADHQGETTSRMVRLLSGGEWVYTLQRNTYTLWIWSSEKTVALNLRHSPSCPWATTTFHFQVQQYTWANQPQSNSLFLSLPYENALLHPWFPWHHSM